MWTVIGKTILITGANRGVGRALVEEALKRGAKKVYAGTRQPFDHSDTRVERVELDVTSTEQTRAAAARIGQLDLLINNAGVAIYDDLSDRGVIETQLSVNLFGTHGVSQAFLPQLTESKGGIVNVLSVAAWVGSPGTELEFAL